MPRSQEGLARLVARRIGDPRVADAFRTVAREDFVPASHKGEAYRDRPVPIPGHQTTSQPSLIALMLAAVRPREGDRALEVGTGFGFQTALLARLCREVVSLERIPELAVAARGNLERRGVPNATVVVGDGTKGWPERAPYDVIVVAAAATGDVPKALVDQLAEGGRLVAPVSDGLSDNVLLLEKEGGRVGSPTLLTPARFVPLVPDGPSSMG
jgi:protein-L-isoaspartate(D-aspartate) O-methyltransferase